MDDLINKIMIEAIEKEEEFIFTTINPWCEDVMQRKISKRDLERALTLYFNGGSIFDKIRAEIEALEEGITSYHNDRPWVFKYEVLKIIDKYRESEDKE